MINADTDHSRISATAPTLHRIYIWGTDCPGTTLIKYQAATRVGELRADRYCGRSIGSTLLVRIIVSHLVALLLRCRSALTGVVFSMFCIEAFLAHGGLQQHSDCFAAMYPDGITTVAWYGGGQQYADDGDDNSQFDQCYTTKGSWLWMNLPASHRNSRHA